MIKDRYSRVKTLSICLYKIDFYAFKNEILFQIIRNKYIFIKF